jgi:hypothetical protein
VHPSVNAAFLKPPLFRFVIEQNFHVHRIKKKYEKPYFPSHINEKDPVTVEVTVKH